MSTRNQLHLSAAISGFGYHPGASAERAQRLIDISYYGQLLHAAERARLDFVLLEDARAVPEQRAYGRLDALTVFSRLAPETSALGLAVSKPTTYSEPFTVSRELATLDLVSAGRAAWHVSTLADDREAQNYGETHALAAETRAAIADEFVEVSRELWDSWEDDAIILDRERGLYIDPHKLHHINHVGAHFKIRGPQITYRPPQGHVVVIQIDQGEASVPLSAKLADVLVLHHNDLVAAQQAYSAYQQEASTVGRSVRIFQSILPILGATEVQAQERAAALDAAADIYQITAEPYAKRLVGTADDIADVLEQWFRAEAADGFHLLPAVLPDGLLELSDQLIPALQRRGLFRTEYSGQTLREHLGLPRPASRYIGAPSDAFTAYDEA